MRLEGLTAAPWRVEENPIRADIFGVVTDLFPVAPSVTTATSSRDDAEFIALARNAFDVMMRREWEPRRHCGKWGVVMADGYHFVCTWDGDVVEADDPFTALVEADRLMNEEMAVP